MIAMLANMSLVLHCLDTSILASPGKREGMIGEMGFGVWMVLVGGMGWHLIPIHTHTHTHTPRSSGQVNSGSEVSGDRTEEYERVVTRGKWEIGRDLKTRIYRHMFVVESGRVVDRTRFGYAAMRSGSGHVGWEICTWINVYLVVV
jgi:hypothetical protein